MEKKDVLNKIEERESYKRFQQYNAQEAASIEAERLFKLKLASGQLYRANLDESLTLKNLYELEKYWCRLGVKIWDKETLEYIDKTIIKSFLPSDWKNFQLISGEHKDPDFWWRSIAHFTSCELLHDPTLVNDPEILRIK